MKKEHRDELNKYNVQYNDNLEINKDLNLYIRGKGENIIIGEHVTFAGNIDLRNRENGKIIIKDNVVIDTDTRLVVANDATIIIGEQTKIGPYNIINAGENLTLGKNITTAGFVYINSSEHSIKRNELIQNQGYSHAPITIGDDVLIGGHACINKGVNIGHGAVIGANSVVTKDIPDYAVAAGVPAKVIRYRE